jgi:hypothetical protein
MGCRLMILTLALVALGSSPLPVEAAEAPTRSEYVLRLEGICKPNAEATRRVVGGVRSDVRAERFATAAAKFSRAERIFSRTVAKIAAVPRPPADAATLSRWFGALGKEKVYLGQIVATLRAEELARFQRVSADFIHQGNKANIIVVSFGFNYCAFKPSRFQ